MLAKEKDEQKEQQGLVQMTMRTESVVCLLYTDTVLTLKDSLLSGRLLDISSLLTSIMEVQKIFCIHFRFGSLFHLSLERPKPPLTPQTEAKSTSLAKRCRHSDRARRGRKMQSKLGTKTAPQFKLIFNKIEGTTRNSITTTPVITPLTPVHQFGGTYYPGWRSRRHSITAHNAPSHLPSVASRDRRLTRRLSIGPIDECTPTTHFPATIMYAKMVAHLENSLETGRRYYRLQKFCNCFCGHSIVDCLIAYCLTTLNSDIKREKAREMCRRLLSHGVIENVSHRRQQDKEGIIFKSSRLYRFTGKHFWETNRSIESGLDGGTTSASMPSLIQSSGIRRQRASSIKKMYTSFSESKTGFVRRCKSRFSLKTSHTI